LLVNVTAPIPCYYALLLMGTGFYAVIALNHWFYVRLTGKIDEQ
jgi:hypothetical protein